MVATAVIGAGSNITIAKAGHGLMRMTAENPVSDEQAFESIKAGIDALPIGVKAFLNGGEHYGADRINLKLISRFFKRYPDYIDRAFLSVKGGLKVLDLKTAKIGPDSSPDGLRRSVTSILEALDGAKKLDLFECARVDPNVPIEEAVATMKDFVNEGLFDYIGLSETSAQTLAKASKVHPIAAVEIEVSLWSYEEETKKVIETARELGVTVIGYSPIGRGFLTSQLTKPEDIPENDFRRRFTRFAPENFDHNLKLVHAISAIAERKGATPAQLAIAWVSQLGPHVVPLPGSSKKERTIENWGGVDLQLSSEELQEIDEILNTFSVKGGRYVDAMAAQMFLWG